MPSYELWPRYVNVDERKRRAQAQLRVQTQKGTQLRPVQIAGKAITNSFWGLAWCHNLESYSDFENRLPRGRSYVRCGAVIDLQIRAGVVSALVQGRDLYRVQVDIKAVTSSRWQELRRRCIGGLASLVDLLSGRLPRQMMSVVTDRTHGLFPSPAELQMTCSCPDWATMCKHVAATLYGVGARFDSEPELLFTLRGVDPTELLLHESSQLSHSVPAGPDLLRVESGELGALFGIELSPGGSPPSPPEQLLSDERFEPSEPSERGQAAQAPPPSGPTGRQPTGRAATGATPAKRGTKKPRTAFKGAQKKTAAQFSEKEQIRALKKLLDRLKRMEQPSKRRAR